MSRSGPYGEPHRLAHALAAAVRDEFPPPDGVIELLPADAAGTEAVVEFTGHAFVLSNWDGASLLLAGHDAFGGASSVPVVSGLIGPGGVAGSLDMVLVRRAGPGEVVPLPETDAFDDHPRVVRSRHHRQEVRVFGDERGLATIGRGLVGRTEVSVELIQRGARTQTGRNLVLGAMANLPDDEWVFAQVAPGNAASVRAFLGIGFVPIGSEILLDPGPGR